MKAKYHAKCRECSGLIEPKSEVVRHPDTGRLVHAECAPFVLPLELPVNVPATSTDYYDVTPGVRKSFDQIMPAT